MQQLESVIQSNSASSEELAATATVLAEQVEQLRGNVAYFHLDARDARDARAGREPRATRAVAPSAPNRFARTASVRLPTIVSNDEAA
jgi:septal ring factor EnvC (AmiA/AmiB activator)